MSRSDKSPLSVRAIVAFEKRLAAHMAHRCDLVVRYWGIGSHRGDP